MSAWRTSGMEVCAFVLVAPLSIPTVSLDALASLCRTTSPQPPVWSPLRVWPSGLHCSDPAPPPLLTLQPRDPSVLWGRERTPSCPWVRPEPPQLCAGSQILCGPGKPIRGPTLASLLQVHPPGAGQPPQRLPRPLRHPCRSLACGQAGLGDQPRFRDSGFVGLGPQSRGRWGLCCGQTALRKGPSAWWLNPEALPPVGGGQCPGRQSPLRLPSRFQLWEASLSSPHPQPGFSPKCAPASGGPSWRAWIFLHPCMGAAAFQVQSPAPESRPSTPPRLLSAWRGQGRAAEW